MVSYAITVSNELNEISKLIPFIISNKKNEDEIVVLFDNTNGSLEVNEYLTKIKDITLIKSNEFKNNFADWKNLLSSYCKKKYIFQIDADEMIDKYIIDNLHQILNSNIDVDLIYLPRINIVNGIDDEHLKKWGWNINENKYINSPDYQGRIFKNGLLWYGKIHEKIVGFKNYALLPIITEYSLYHEKTLVKQIKQNSFYNQIS
jgi:hypothetical protein